jgi:hypothetical protein
MSTTPALGCLEHITVRARRGPGDHGRRGANHGPITKVGEYVICLLTDLGYNDEAVATLRQSTAILSVIELRSHGPPAGLVYCNFALQSG